MRKRDASFVLLAVLLAASAPARGGHEFPIYPSFYPQEIRIEPVAPDSAAALLAEGRIHAYVGAEPAAAETLPEFVAHVESLGAYIVLTVNPASEVATDPAAACELAAAAARALVGAGFVLHPYPVTPYHADYLNHFDRAEAARARILNAADRVGLRLRAADAAAQHLVPERLRATGTGWDVGVAAVDSGGLLVGEIFGINGWFGPPWLKDGWFHAYRLLAGTLRDAKARIRADATALRLKEGGQARPEERIGMERELIALLTEGCMTTVAGYTVRREYYSTEYSNGIENIAYDSQAGLNSPIFIRTVKLKDFPWNGWLTLGTASRPSAAWNPIGGFTDPAGRLIWAAIGDLALFPEPYGGGWTLNRIGGLRAVPEEREP